MKKKTTYLMIGLIVLLLLTLGLKILFTGASTSPAPGGDNIPIFRPSSSSTPPSGDQVSVEPMKIIGTNISDKAVSINVAIALTFSKKISPNGLTIKLEPDTPFKVGVDSSETKISIEPVTTWEFEKRYTINVSENSFGTDKSRLDKNYQFNFVTEKYLGF